MKKDRDLLKFLIKKYGYDVPIFVNEISFNNYSDIWIKKELSKLCDSKKIVHYEKGIYYIPTITTLGRMELDPLKVIEKKYISNGNKCNGYYSGDIFNNLIGLSTQVPNVIELYTNNEQAKIREVKVGFVKVILRKARCTINKANVATLCLLELMNSVSPNYITNERRKIIKDYIVENNITRDDITKYASSYPDKAIRNLVESEVIYEIK